MVIFHVSKVHIVFLRIHDVIPIALHFRVIASQNSNSHISRQFLRYRFTYKHVFYPIKGYFQEFRRHEAILCIMVPSGRGDRLATSVILALDTSTGNLVSFCFLVPLRHFSWLWSVIRGKGLELRLCDWPVVLIGQSQRPASSPFPRITFHTHQSFLFK